MDYNSEPTHLKRVVIKEELVAITGDFINAIILNQFMYWSERVKDFDKLLIEEQKIATKEGVTLNVEIKNGWIYKKAEELIEETMIDISQSSMRTRIKKLIEQGFLFERNNPLYKWDHTKQYRVNFNQVKKSLEDKGYTLQEYKMPENGAATESQNLRYEPQPTADRISNSELRNSNSEEQYQRLLTEITLDKKVSKKESAAKKTTKEVKKSFNGIIEEYTDNEELRKMLRAFVQMRAYIKKPLTNTGLELLLEELDKLSDNVYEKINIVSESVMKSWKGFFPLKGNQVAKVNSSEASYSIEEFEKYNILDYLNANKASS